MLFGRGYNGLYHCFDRFGFMRGSGWMLLLALLIIAVIITVVLLAARNNRRQQDSRALEELKLKFARGEISEDDYVKRKKMLD